MEPPVRPLTTLATISTIRHCVICRVPTSAAQIAITRFC